MFVMPSKDRLHERIFIFSLEQVDMYMALRVTDIERNTQILHAI